MLDPATDVDLVAGASVSVANVSGCQYFSCLCLWLPVPQLPVSLAASIGCQCLWLPISVASFSGCQYLSCQCLGCLYLNCRCLCPGCWCLLVPWLVSRLCAMVAEDITKQLLRTVVRRLSRIPMSHQHSCPVSRPSSPQTTTDQVICNTKNVMNI